MTTLKEQQMIAAHQLGMRDYTDKRPMLVPVFLTDDELRTAYEAGWRGAAKRALENDPLVRMPKVLIAIGLLAIGLFVLTPVTANACTDAASCQAQRDWLLQQITPPPVTPAPPPKIIIQVLPSQQVCGTQCQPDFDGIPRCVRYCNNSY